MGISVRQSGSVTILDLNGRFTKGSSDVPLRQTASQQVSGGKKRILLNMQGVTLIDSSGIGELVAAKQSAGRSGVSIKLLHVEDKVMGVLKMAGVAGSFEMFDDEIDAIRSFG